MNPTATKPGNATGDALVQYVTKVQALNSKMHHILACNHEVVDSLSRAAQALRSIAAARAGRSANPS